MWRASAVPFPAPRRFSPAALLPLSLGLLSLGLAGCSSQTPEPQAEETEIPADLQTRPVPAPKGMAVQPGTPMAQRVAIIGVLNKRNNLSQDLEMKPGESRRLGNVIVRLAACERTPPWELPSETGAFVQVLVRDTGGKQDWRKVFSGWLFKHSPSLNVVEHPIYDVWVKDCKMSFPGEETASKPAESSAAPAASPSPAATPAPVASSDE